MQPEKSQPLGQRIMPETKFTSTAKKRTNSVSFVSKLSPNTRKDLYRISKQLSI